MKYVVYLTILIFSFVSCKKEISPIEATKKNIQGRWNLKTYTSTGYDASGFATSTNTYNYKSGDYIEFTETQFTVSIDNKIIASEPYTLTNARHFSTPEFQNTTNGKNIFREVDIKELTSGSLILYIVQLSNGSTVASTGDYAATK